jgi:hypothetical protein
MAIGVDNVTENEIIYGTFLLMKTFVVGSTVFIKVNFELFFIIREV